ncbi:hypothetical protein ACFCY8_36590 [Streptomyces noursei]|uniref:hypothetical protein n=1 Tax=Streptomyces noursei TaxID=1971 RepID=UPI0035E10C0A
MQQVLDFLAWFVDGDCCDMGRGASGGPIATTEAQIISANSHYEVEADGVTRKNDDLFGSEHGDQAVFVINEINK